MKALIGVLALLLAGAAPAAETYKWVDERGITNYGEKPPAGRPARLVDTQPAGTVEAEGVQKQPVMERRPAPDSHPLPPVTPAPPVAGPVRGMNFQTFIHLRSGMTEGELMLRAGRPDFESVENFRHDVVKSYYYYPTVADPFITVITVRGGRVAGIERNRKTY